jgi:hypothetical protein
MSGGNCGWEKRMPSPKKPDWVKDEPEGEDVIQWIYIILLVVFVGLPILKALISGWAV